MKDKDKQNRKELKILRKIYIVKLRELDENDSADNLEWSSVKGDSNWIIAVFLILSICLLQIISLLHLF